LEAALRTHALGFPEAREDFPWGERAIKVKEKVFLFLRADDKEVSFSVKLPQTGYQALALPFVEPAHYGLGRHGWVTARLPARGQHSVDDLKAWIEESYRAVAPKKLVSQLDGSSAGKAAKGAAPAPKAAKRATPAAKGTKRASPAARKRR
jgi:predicted DNA-binding protein (MmcQ/YjbR family)